MSTRQRSQQSHAYADDWDTVAFDENDDPASTEASEQPLDWLQTLQARAREQRSRLVLGVLLLVSLYFLAAFGEQALRIRELQAQADDLQAGNAQVSSANDLLSDKLAHWEAGGYLPYVEGRARRDLLLARPDENVIAVRWHDPAVLTVPQQSATPDAEPRPNWRRWLDVLTGADATDSSTAEQTP